MPKKTTGVAPSSDSAAVDRCCRAARSGKSGGTLEIAMRRLNPAAAMATMSNVVWWGRRLRGGWSSVTV